jgi:hypothetical protein
MFKDKLQYGINGDFHVFHKLITNVVGIRYEISSPNLLVISNIQPYLFTVKPSLYKDEISELPMHSVNHSPDFVENRYGILTII